jgi:glycosyltransferase involved in cell wall biosynthesis
MYNPLCSIIREAKRKRDEPLNILTFVAHERYEPSLCETGHNFYSVITEETRYWHEEYAPIPKNYSIFRDAVPHSIINGIDLIISHNPFVHIPLAHNLGLQVPTINIFHTMPTPDWDNQNLPPNAKSMFDWCTEHVYISEFNKYSWGYDRGEVILHGIDTELFKPGNKGPRTSDKGREAFYRLPRVLTVANDYINRDWCLGFGIWNAIANELPMFPVGDTPGLSKPAPSLDAMIEMYQDSLVFLNTSTASPIPMSLLEAMACGCACVSAATCLIPDVIEDGVNGFLCPPHKPEMFKDRCKYLLDNPDTAMEMGLRARDTIKDMFGLDRFVKEWNDLIWRVV